MRRRDLLAYVGGAAASWPLVSRGQSVKVHTIGIIALETQSRHRYIAEAFFQGLVKAGFVDGRDFSVEYRFAEGDQSRLPELLADLVSRRVALIFTSSNVLTLAAKRTTEDIPIVFIFGLDPVHMGVVKAMNRPGGNATGVSFPTSALVPKSVELIRELLPHIRPLAALINPANPNAELHARNLRKAAQKFGLHMQLLNAQNESEIDAAFAAVVHLGAEALIVTSDPMFDVRRRRLVDLAAHHAIPTIYPWRDFVDAGGLLSYGNSITEAARQAGVYAGQILKGDKPADMPIWIPTVFELAVNLRTAKAFGLIIPESILARADEVIE